MCKNCERGRKCGWHNGIGVKGSRRGVISKLNHSKRQVEKRRLQLGYKPRKSNNATMYTYRGVWYHV